MKPKHIYIAALFSRREEMARVADSLTICGFKIVARWVYGGEEGLTREQIALLDIEDVDKADIVLSFSQPHGSFNRGGGRHVEFGYGLAQGKRAVVIGEREVIFHHYPTVEVYPSLDAWLGSEGLANVA